MKALIFDCDGVLVDTERDGHYVAFIGKKGAHIAIRMVVLSIIVLAGIGVSMVALGTDWLQWRGPSRNDISSESSGWPEILLTVAASGNFCTFSTATN